MRRDLVRGTYFRVYEEEGNKLYIAKIGTKERCLVKSTKEIVDANFKFLLNLDESYLRFEEFKNCLEFARNVLTDRGIK